MATTSGPLFNLPPMVKALASTLFLVFLLTWFLDDMQTAMLMDRYAFIPSRYVESGVWTYEGVISPLTYMFLHGGWVHLGINLAMLLAFGSPVERRLGSLRFLLYFLICGVLSAVVYMALNWGSPLPVVGASGAISGVFGGLVIMMGRNWRNIITMVVVWLLLNALNGVAFQPEPGTLIAWEAHMGGFLAGLLLFPWISRRT